MDNHTDTQAHHWHTPSVDEVAQRLETNQKNGLTSAKVAKRTACHKPTQYL